MARSYPRFFTNLTKKERILRKSFNKVKWSVVPYRRVIRMIERLYKIIDVQTHNKVRENDIAAGRPPKTRFPKKYPALDFSESEYEAESTDTESVESNEPLRRFPRPHKRIRTTASCSSLEECRECPPEVHHTAPPPVPSGDDNEADPYVVPPEDDILVESTDMCVASIELNASRELNTTRDSDENYL